MSKTATAMDRIVKLPFRVVGSTAIAKTASGYTFTELEVKPANLGTRVVAIAACFEYFRVSKLRLKVSSTVVGPVRNRDGGITDVTIGVIGGLMGCGYIDSDASRTGVPTSLNELIQLPVADMGSLYSDFVLDVPRKVLFGTPVKWFDTGSQGTPPSGNQVQGIVTTMTFNIHVNDASATDSAIVVAEGDIEFRGMIAPALSFSQSLLPDQEMKDDASDGWVAETASVREPRLAMPSLAICPPGGPPGPLSGKADQVLEDPGKLPKRRINRPSLL